MFAHLFCYSLYSRLASVTFVKLNTFQRKPFGTGGWLQRSGCYWRECGGEVGTAGGGLVTERSVSEEKNFE